MGGGYSGNFSGTTGAVGEKQNYQSALLDKFPVRTKVTAASAGGIGAGIGGAGSEYLMIRRKKCSCCGEKSIPARTEYTVCPICGWIDDPYQNRHLDSLDGKNAISLEEAREIYKRKHSS